MKQIKEKDQSSSGHKMTVGDLMEFAKKHPLPRKIKNLQKDLEEVDRDFEPEMFQD